MHVVRSLALRFLRGRSGVACFHSLFRNSVLPRSSDLNLLSSMTADAIGGEDKRKLKAPLYLVGRVFAGIASIVEASSVLASGSAAGASPIRGILENRSREDSRAVTSICIYIFRIVAIFPHSKFWIVTGVVYHAKPRNSGSEYASPS